MELIKKAQEGEEEKRTQMQPVLLHSARAFSMLKTIIKLICNEGCNWRCIIERRLKSYLVKVCPRWTRWWMQMWRCDDESTLRRYYYETSCMRRILIVKFTGDHHKKASQTKLCFLRERSLITSFSIVFRIWNVTYHLNAAFVTIKSSVTLHAYQSFQ